MTDDPSRENPLKIGTRGSPLALAQAAETRSRLMSAHNLAQDAFVIEVIQTSGDRIQDRPLSEVGGKGLFTKEIEEALLDGRIDIAVHSMKDMPVVQPEGLGLTTYLPREDVRDAFISRRFGGLADLPKGAVLGSSSLRRRAQVLYRRPDLKLVEFRGNVQTRLRKLDQKLADATFLAVAGLNRLGQNEMARSPVGVDEMLPAVAQGAIGIEQRLGDARVSALLAPLDHYETSVCLRAERAFLAGLDGSCQTPIAGLAVLDGTEIWLRGEIIKPDGSQLYKGERRGLVADASLLGQDLAAELKLEGGAGFFS